MKFGAVTLTCLVVSMTLALYGYRPALMLVVAVACAVVFVRRGDGRTHSWTPAVVEETKQLHESVERPRPARTR